MCENQDNKLHVFISYARVDNQIPRGAEVGWVDAFEETLKQQLTQRLGRMDDVHIFLDKREIKGHEIIDNKIKKALEKSHALVIVFSKGYISSDWCKQELAYFSATLNKSDKVFPVFIEGETVLRETINTDVQFLALRNKPGYEFYSSEKRKLLGYPAPDKEEFPYYLHIVDIGIDIAKECSRDLQAKLANTTDCIKVIISDEDISPETNCRVDDVRQDNARHLVFVNQAKTDQLKIDNVFADQFIQALIENNIPYVASLTDKNISPNDAIADFELHLGHCDVMVLFCGDTPVTWLRRQVINAWSRRKSEKPGIPLKRIAILDTPRVDGKCGINMGGFSELKLFACGDLQDASCFHAFLADLASL